MNQLTCNFQGTINSIVETLILLNDRTNKYINHFSNYRNNEMYKINIVIKKRGEEHSNELLRQTIHYTILEGLWILLISG